MGGAISFRDLEEHLFHAIHAEIEIELAGEFDVTPAVFFRFLGMIDPIIDLLREINWIFRVEKVLPLVEGEGRDGGARGIAQNRGDPAGEALEHHVKMRRGIVIYPEAHIWPYCTKIRPFGDAAFTYPAEMDVATVPFCVTYRKRRFRKNKSPLMTVHVGKPIYPNMRKSLPERKKELRDRVYDYMIDRACEDENVEWVSYVRKKEEKKD